MNWKNELTLAINACQSSGIYLKQQKVESKEILSAEGKDIKIKADLESEKIILSCLRDKSSYPILSEEQSIPEDVSSLYWIVDPLDGSYNYKRGLDICAISIALWEASRPILGVIYDFMNDKLYHGIVGEKAQCNDSDIIVSDIRYAKDAVLVTGFPVCRDYSQSSLEKFICCIQKFKKIRMLGSAALSLAHVSCAKVDAYMEEGIMLWDVAAGIAIVQAAGGYVSIHNNGLNPFCMDVKCSSQASLW